MNYIGTHAVHLLDRHNIAQPPIPASSLAFCEQQDPVTGVYVNITQAPCTVVSRLPYPNFNGFYIDSDFHGYSNYNAGNVKFVHQAGKLAITAISPGPRAWTTSRQQPAWAPPVSGYQGFENNHDPNLDYGPSDFDVDHRFVASYIYQLPFGRGKRFGGGINRAEDLAIGGWQVTGITTFQTGFPFSITANDIQSLNNTPVQACEYCAGLQDSWQSDGAVPAPQYGLLYPAGA